VPTYACVGGGWGVPVCVYVCGVGVGLGCGCTRGCVDACGVCLLLMLVACVCSA
jgi:hypothetical protein